MTDVLRPQELIEPCCELGLEPAEEERLVGMFKALGNPQRFEIIKFLLTHPGCMTGDIVEHLPIAQATVSQHLKVLRDAGWIDGLISGPARRYCISREGARWFRIQVARCF